MDIKKPDRKALRSYFVKNAVPTASNFADLIDGAINQKDDGFAKPPNEPLSIEADGDNTSQKKAINFYRNFTDPKVAWTLSLNPRADPANAATAKPGWSINDADGNSKLFIDQATGNIGLGTVAPGGYRLNVNGPAFVAGNIYPVAEDAGRLRVGAVWGMPGLFSGEDGAKPLTLGAPAGQKVYLGENTADAFVEAGTGNAWFKGKVGIGPGADAAGGALDVRTGGAGGWDRLVVKTTNLWGDGDRQYVTIGEGGAGGIMLHNPHVVWMNGEQRASIRMGRSGGNGGSYWDVGVRADSGFSIINPDLKLSAITIDRSGKVGIGTPTAAERLEVNGRLKAGALTMGPWPASEGGYAFIGLSTLNHADSANYALLVGTGSETGRTFLNSPVDIRFRVKNSEQLTIQSGAATFSGNVYATGGIGCGGKIWIRTAHNNVPYLGVTPTGGAYAGPNKQAWEAFTLEMACSRTMKDNIHPLSSAEAMATLAQLSPVKYDYKEEKIFRQHLGFIAEDMPDNLATESRQSLSPFEITPILTRVAQQQQKDLLAVRQKVDEAIDYSALIAPLIETVKRQQAQIDALQAEVRALTVH